MLQAHHPWQQSPTLPTSLPPTVRSFHLYNVSGPRFLWHFLGSCFWESYFSRFVDGFERGEGLSYLSLKLKVEIIGGVVKSTFINC